MIKLFKASMMDKNNREHQLDKNKKSRKEKKIKPLRKKLFFSKDQKRMGKSLTKKSRKEGEKKLISNNLASLHSFSNKYFHKHLLCISKITLNENKIINYYHTQTTIITNKWNKRGLIHCDKLQTKKLLLT